jgi:hypothetical protein
MMAAEAVFVLRQAFWQRGYRPIAVWNPDQKTNDKGEPLNSPGKQPRGRWREAASEDPPEAARLYPDARALNTGIACGDVVAFDIDVLNQDLVDQIVAYIEREIDVTPLVRIGLAPKTLLAYRPDRAFPKVQTPEFFFLDGTKAKVEVLADGQQFIADGIHPDTGEAYYWTDLTPAEVPLAQLPVVSEEAAHAIIAAAADLIRAAGGREKESPEKKAAASKGNGLGENFFSRVNSAALEDLAVWVSVLFPRAHREPGTGAWRICSKDLGRDLEEDVSIHPEGIRDFGEERSLTAIDLVMRYGNAVTAVEAALWLCEQLTIDPKTLGYQPPTAQPKTAPVPAADPGEGVSPEDFCSYMPAANYIFLPTMDPWPGKSVNARIKPLAVLGPDGKPKLDEETKEPILITAARWLDQNHPVEQMTWAPGSPTIIANRLVADGGWITRQGVTCLNLYRPPTLAPGDAGKAGPWLDHVQRVFPDDAEHIVKWLAHRKQRPGEKINHALVIGGLQGIGKDSILEPVKRAIGPWNFSEPSPSQLLGRFNGFAKAVILRISEARDLGDIDRYQFYERLKVYCSAPPDTLRVDEKHLREYSIFNCCGVIITTNYKTDGIYLPADDRRHYVAWSTCSKEDFSEDYWIKLWAWYDNGGDRHVGSYLAELDLSPFNPKAPPPKTQAFWEIVDAHRSSEDAEIADLIDLCQKPDATTLSRLILRASDVSTSLFDWLSDRKNRRIIPHRLETAGYVPVRNDTANDGLWKISSRRQVVYAKASLTRQEQLKAAQNLIK